MKDMPRSIYGRIHDLRNPSGAPREKSEMREVISTEKYYVITSGCDGTSLREYTKEKLLQAIQEGEVLLESEEEPLLPEFPTGGWFMGDDGGTMIIRGQIVVPKPVKVVEEYDVP